MTPETDFYLEAAATLLFSLGIFVVMMRMQKEKERQAELKFQRTMAELDARARQRGEYEKYVE